MRYALWGLFGPVSWPFWLLAVGVGALLLHRPRLAKHLLIGALALSIAFVLTPLGRWLMAPLENPFPPVSAPGEIDHVVVLAGGEELHASARSGRLELGEAGDRILHGALLAQRNPSAFLWIAGYGATAGAPASDTGLTAETWQALGIDGRRIREVGHTADTCQNAAGLAALKPAGRILLVTSAFHMRRAIACFEAVGLKVIPYPVDHRLSARYGLPKVLQNLSMVDDALHEWIGLAYYRLMGRIG